MWQILIITKKEEIIISNAYSVCTCTLAVTSDLSEQDHTLKVCGQIWQIN